MSISRNSIASFADKRSDAEKENELIRIIAERMICPCTVPWLTFGEYFSAEIRRVAVELGMNTVNVTHILQKSKELSERMGGQKAFQEQLRPLEEKCIDEERFMWFDLFVSCVTVPFFTAALVCVILQVPATEDESLRNVGYFIAGLCAVMSAVITWKRGKTKIYREMFNMEVAARVSAQRNVVRQYEATQSKMSSLVKQTSPSSAANSLIRKIGKSQSAMGWMTKIGAAFAVCGAFFGMLGFKRWPFPLLVGLTILGFRGLCALVARKNTAP